MGEGYYRFDGTYMQPYLRSTPNNTLLDNFSTRGNVNPYSGNPIYVSPYPSGTYGTRGRS